MEYYSLDKILKTHSEYNLIVGMRSNGKTYACLLHGLREYIQNHSAMGYIRRYREDFVGKRGDQLFSALVENNEVAKLSNNQWTGIVYRAKRWYLTKLEDDGTVTKDETPFCFGFSLTEMEHDKSVSYPNIRTVVFDEFITRQYYLADEFVLFENVLSTIIRRRTDVTIFMLGNTVNKFCPYFKDMGLRHITEMAPGTIDVYKTVKNLKIAVEYCAEAELTTGKENPSNFYFSFDNPKLEMITGGIWELDIYPHLPNKYTPKDVCFRYFIEFDEQFLQADIVFLNLKTPVIFTYIHTKTTPLKYPDTDIVFSLTPTSRPNWFRNILKPSTDIERKICHFFKTYRVFYQDNDVGELVKNYLKVAQKESLLT